MSDFALRIAAASSDASALLALAIELNAALTGSEATVNAMREADAQRKTKQADRQRRKRTVTGRDVTLRGVTGRDAASPPSPQVSPSFPTPHITPSFPPPPHPPADDDSDGVSVFLARLAPATQGVVRAFLEGMPFARRLGWVAVFGEVMDDGPRLAPEEFGRALSHFTANVDRSNWTTKYFRGYCRNVRSEPAPTAEAPADGDGGEAFAAIRAMVKEIPNPGRGVIRMIPRADVERLGARALAAYNQIGGADRFLDQSEKVGFLLRDFKAAFRQSGHPTPTEERASA